MCSREDADPAAASRVTKVRQNEHATLLTVMLREFKIPILYIKVRLGTCILTAYAPLWMISASALSWR